MGAAPSLLTLLRRFGVRVAVAFSMEAAFTPLFRLTGQCLPHSHTPQSSDTHACPFTHTHTHTRTHSLFEWLGSTEVCLRLMRMPANSLWMDGIAHHGALMGAIRARTLPVERFPGREVLIIFVLCLCFHHALIWIDLMVIHTHSLCRL